MPNRRIAVAWLSSLALTACGGEPQPFDDGGPSGATAVFAQGDPAPWSTPWPGDHRVRDDTRRVDLSTFPDPEGVPIVGQLVGALDDRVQGWSLSGALYLPFDAPLRPGPLVEATTHDDPDAAVLLVDVDPDSPTVGQRHPIDAVARQGGSYGPPWSIAALPLPGIPLRPRTRYALVVRRPLTDAEGLPLGTPPAIADLVRGRDPRGWRIDVAEQYLDALDILFEAEPGLAPETLAGLTVFTTGRPTGGFLPFVDAMREEGFRLAAPYTVTEVFEDYCVFEAKVTVPVFQAGEPPYDAGEGAWAVDDDGEPLLQRTETARLWITLPRTEPPETDWPTVVFARTGGGGDRPLVDRGIRTTAGEDTDAGTGYAATFARAGWAGIMFDGPLGGERNPTGGDEQFLVFDIDNPDALRDNLRQTAGELAAFADFVDDLAIRADDCPGAELPFGIGHRFDTGHLALFGHSMGATVAPLALWAEPRYDAVILSGAGGSWIENVLRKERPLPTRPIAASLLGLEDPASVDRLHPALTLLQWAGEAADPPTYLPDLGPRADGTRALPHVLMLQGVVDRYIPPEVANATSLSFGLDLAGPALDAPAVPDQRSVADVLPLAGGTALPLPAGGNRDGGTRTAIVVQHPEDGVEGGHEAAYQQPAAYQQVRCFLEAIADDAVPTVPAGGVEGDPCPGADDLP